MGCVITSGIATPACDNRFSPPGIVRTGIWVFNFDEVASYTSTVEGEVSGITFTPSYKTGFKIDMHKDSISWTEELQADPASAPFYNQTLTGKIISFDTTTRNSIEDLVDVDLVFAVKGKNNIFHVLGETSGLKLTENTKTTGAIAGDEIGDVLTFTGVNNGKARVFFNTDAATTETTLDGYL